MIEIKIDFIEGVLSEFAILQTELKAHRDYLQMLYDICPAELMRVYKVPPQEDNALQAILNNDRQHQVSLYLTKTIEDFIKSLPAEERLFIETRYFKSQSWSCVAEHLNISTSTAKSRWRKKVLDKGVEFFLANPCPPLPTVKRGLMESIQCPRL